MRLQTLLLAFLFACAARAAGNDESFQGALQRGAAQPSQYSFADLYRLAVGQGAGPGYFIVPANEAPVRAAAVPLPAQFSVGDAPKPELGLLLLSGLAAAVWVARRRLGYGL
jgi:MYXO-CTERM domain-containing protein